MREKHFDRTRYSQRGVDFGGHFTLFVCGYVTTNIVSSSSQLAEGKKRKKEKC